MITVQKEAITALAGLKWTRKNIGEAMNVSTGNIQEVLGKSNRGRKPKAVVIAAKVTRKRATK